YTRRRISQPAKADVEEILHVPAAIALRQRPGIPGVRSTFGTGTELLNSLRLMFSRLASHKCPHCGHYHAPSLAVAAEHELLCEKCGTHFYGPSAEDLSFNSTGACEKCGGTGVVMTVDRSTLVPNVNLTIDEGAVAPWNSLMFSLMTDVCRAMGVRTDVPFKDLTEQEKETVYDGPAVKKTILYKAKKGNTSGELDFTYYNAVYTVENALAKVTDEKGMKRVEKFLKSDVCSCCHGSRLSEKARAPRIDGIGLDIATEKSLDDAVEWVKHVPQTLPEDMRKMAANIGETFLITARRLLELGLGYLTLDRATSTLSTGERQRMALARVVRNRTTGVLYVLDEPSIGLHPANNVGLIGVMKDLVADGNSVALVDHDTQILRSAGYIIEMGPGAGAGGGQVIAKGSVEEIEANPDSKIGPFLAGKDKKRVRSVIPAENLWTNGAIKMETNGIHTVKPLTVEIPKGRMTVVTGVSGSGKTTMVLESLVPALIAGNNGKEFPAHVKSVDAAGIANVKLIDSTPIGANVRSTVATYANIHDDLRKIFAHTPEANAEGYKAGDFSYNTGKLRCPVCDGTGTVSLDVQFLPDVDIPCPECHGSRYSKDAWLVHYRDKHNEEFSLPELMADDVDEAIEKCKSLRTVCSRLETLHGLGLGYLTLGEATPSLSGGEAQRLKLASEMGREQSNTMFVFDEPTIGLHPLDVRTLLEVFQRLIEQGATVVIIEHDTDLIRNADYIIDMGPGGGESGGRIVATGTPEEIAGNENSLTGKYL
ncbi:MAG: excinuclease ABC subunit UvrA, partial [Paramuribaculum sp.]|nr:excinuclease ABC subunit UvrA [Paramuribaculum sp.]